MYNFMLRKAFVIFISNQRILFMFSRSLLVIPRDLETSGISWRLMVSIWKTIQKGNITLNFTLFPCTSLKHFSTWKYPIFGVWSVHNLHQFMQKYINLNWFIFAVESSVCIIIFCFFFNFFACSFMTRCYIKASIINCNY